MPPDADLTQATFSRTEAVALARADLDFFASLLMPEQCSLSYPALHKEIWALLCNAVLASEKPNPTPQEKFPQIAIGIPRGFTKTTLVKLLVDWCFFFTKKRFPLLVSSNSPKAENSVADICDMLSEENILQLFGNWKISLETDRVNLKKFSFNGVDRILACLGSGGDPRGLNLKNERPDLIIMDDIQSKENSDSPVQAKALLAWMTSTLMKAKSPHGCIFIYVGNMFSSPGCILKTLRHNPNWTTVVTGGILADGTSLWPELRSVEELYQELRNDIAMGTPEAFFSEIMNDENAGITSCFDITKIPPVPFAEEGNIVPASFIVIDVATDKINADDTTIIYYEVLDGYPVATSLFAGVFSPGDTIKKTLQLCLEKGCYLIAVEGTAYQVSLLYWFDRICREAGIEGIHFVELFTKGRPKTSRILTMFKSLIPDEGTGKPGLYLRNSLRAKVFYEITQFKPGKKDNTDNILDNLAYVQDVMQDYGPLTWNPLSAESISFSEAKVVEFNSPY